MDTGFDKVIMTLPTGKFIWDRVLQDVRFIRKGRKVAQFTLVLTVKENNEQDALAKVCRHLLKKISENKKGHAGRVVTMIVNQPEAKYKV